MKLRITQNIFFVFGLAAFVLLILALNPSEEEMDAQVTSQQLLREAENLERLKNGTGNQELFEKAPQAWERFEEKKKQLLTMKNSREGKAWIFGGVSAICFIVGVACISAGQDQLKEEAENSELSDSSSIRAADSENLSSGVASASPETENFDRGTKGNPIDAKTPIYLWQEGEQKGPWVLSQIRRMWDSGSLTADVKYWTEEMEDWSPLVSLMEEETAVSAPAVPVSPAQSRPKVYKVTYDGKSQTFAGTMPLMVKLAMRAAQDMGWKLENANETLGLVTFKTGLSMGSWSGVSCSLNIEELEEGRFRVVGTGTQNISGLQLAAMNFGEAGRKANKAIERMKILAEKEK